MSLFSNLPQDMLQYEIARFLTSADTIAFNEAVRLNERVYKKFPSDYALKHQLKLKYSEYYQLVEKLYEFFKEVYTMIKSGVLHSDLLDDTAEHLKKLLSFLQSPSNAMLYAYQEGLIEEMSHKIISWKDDLCIQLYESLLADKNSLPIETTIATIKSYRFVRHVDIRGFNSVYS